MTELRIYTQGENCWPDLAQKQVISGHWFGIARLPNGTVQGRPTVTVRIELPDGSTVLAETTLTLLATAVRAFLEVPYDPR